MYTAKRFKKYLFKITELLLPPLVRVSYTSAIELWKKISFSEYNLKYNWLKGLFSPLVSEFLYNIVKWVESFCIESNLHDK